jgi:hypothetical protein
MIRVNRGRAAISKVKSILWDRDVTPIFIFIWKKRGDGQNQRMNNSKCDTPSSKQVYRLTPFYVHRRRAFQSQARTVTKCLGKYVDSSKKEDSTGLYNDKQQPKTASTILMERLMETTWKIDTWTAGH